MRLCRVFILCTTTVGIVLLITSCMYIRHSGLKNHQLNTPSAESAYGSFPESTVMVEKVGTELVSSRRKLLFRGSCTNRDISISQSRDSTSGIPQYVVQIVNTCFAGCAPSNIHLHCGWFASARIVNPRSFKRISFDDCLVNGGKPLKTSQIIRFTYYNSFMYPLAFKSAKFC